MAETTPKQPKILYAMLRRIEDAGKQRELLPKHLEWMREQEKAGRVVLSGPAEPTAANALGGLTIIEAATIEDADALAQQDPMIRSGAMTYSMHRWTVNEGRISLSFTLSDGSASLGRA